MKTEFRTSKYFDWIIPMFAFAILAYSILSVFTTISFCDYEYFSFLLFGNLLVCLYFLFLRFWRKEMLFKEQSIILTKEQKEIPHESISKVYLGPSRIKLFTPEGLFIIRSEQTKNFYSIKTKLIK